MVDLSNKPARQHRSQLIAWRLGKMAEFYREVQAVLPGQEAALAQRHRYVRLLGESIRAISLEPHAPLCKLMHDGRELGDTTNAAELKRALEQEMSQPRVTQSVEPGKRSREERELQAFLIHQALLSEHRLLALQPAAQAQGIDELIFICDELNVGVQADMPDGTDKVTRADMIALGRSGEVYFPVFIELKFDRQRTELLRQLAAIKTEMLDGSPDVVDAFRGLLAAVAGIDAARIDVSRFRKMLVWPSSESGDDSKKTLDTLAAEQVIAVAYKKDDADGFSF